MDAIRHLVRMSTAVANAQALEGFPLSFFFSPLLFIKNIVTFNISIFAFNSNEQSLGLLFGKASVNEVI